MAGLLFPSCSIQQHTWVGREESGSLTQQGKGASTPALQMPGAFLKGNNVCNKFPPPNYNPQRERVREINLEGRVADGIDGFN